MLPAKGVQLHFFYYIHTYICQEQHFAQFILHNFEKGFTFHTKILYVYKEHAMHHSHTVAMIESKSLFAL